jgi:hypothetical protein
MTDSSDYVPPKVWTWNKDSGGSPVTSLNRPTAGATHEKELPVGRHPLQLYSLGTPNGQKVTILLEELLALINGDTRTDEAPDIAPLSKNGTGAGYRSHVEAADRLLRSGRGADAVLELARALELGGEEARREVDAMLGTIADNREPEDWRLDEAGK